MWHLLHDNLSFLTCVELRCGILWLYLVKITFLLTHDLQLLPFKRKNDRLEDFFKWHYMDYVIFDN